MAAQELRELLKEYIPMYLWETIAHPEGYVVSNEEFNSRWNLLQTQGDHQAETIRDILQMLYDTILNDEDGATHLRVDLPEFDTDNLKTVLELIDQRLTADAQALANHKTSNDHDYKYYTKTELNSGQLDSRYYTETELNSGQLDNRYYTESELQATVDGNSGADKIGVTAFSTNPANLQGTLEWLKTQLDAFVLDQIPDGSLTDIKLSSTEGAIKPRVAQLAQDLGQLTQDLGQTDSNVGDLTQLSTTENGSLVGAVNESLDALDAHKADNVSHVKNVQGLWTDKTTSVAGLGTYTKTIPLGFNANKGSLIIGGFSSIGTVYFNKNKENTKSISVINTSSSAFRIAFGADNNLIVGLSGTAYIETIQLESVYISGDNLIIILKNPNGNIRTLDINVSWEVTN